MVRVVNIPKAITNLVHTDYKPWSFEYFYLSHVETNRIASRKPETVFLYDIGSCTKH